MSISPPKNSHVRFNQKLIIASIGIFVIAILFISMLLTEKPQRSVASYCNTYKQEKARLTKLPGDTWPSGVFDDNLSDAGEFASSFAKLEKVAPDDIRPDITTLKQLYEKIDSDPSQAISASLSGTGAETNVKEWTNKHCGN